MPGLQKIEHGKERARAFIPLHRERVEGGSFFVIPLRAGPQRIGWSVVTGGGCDKAVLAGDEGKELDVSFGAPRLVVQDRFGEEKAKQYIRDRSGTYDLFVFDDRYEVRDAKSGDRIVARPGLNPNFSPTGRFVVAQNLTGQNMEVVDLLAGDVVFTFFQGLVGWAHADSIVVSSGSIYGRLEILQAMGGEGGYSDTSGGWPRRMRAWSEKAIRLDVDAGVVFVHSANQRMVLDFATREAVTASGVDIGEGPERLRALLANDTTAAPSGREEPAWSLGKSFRLSNIEAWHEGGGRMRIIGEAQKAYVLTHTILAAPPEYMVLNQVMATRGTRSGYGIAPTVDRLNLRAIARLSETVRLINPSPIAHETFSPPLIGSPDARQGVAIGDLYRRVTRLSPRSASVLKHKAVSDEWAEGCYISETSGEVDIANVLNAWSWGQGGASGYLLHTQCFNGKMQVSYGSLLLVRADERQPVIDIKRALFPK